MSAQYVPSDSHFLFSLRIQLPIQGSTLDFTNYDDSALLLIDSLPYTTELALEYANNCLNCSEALTVLFCIGKLLYHEPDDELVGVFEELTNLLLDEREDTYDGPYMRFECALVANRRLVVEINDNVLSITIDGKEYDKDLLILLLAGVDNADDASSLGYAFSLVAEFLGDQDFYDEIQYLLQNILEDICE